MQISKWLIYAKFGIRQAVVKKITDKIEKPWNYNI